MPRTRAETNAYNRERLNDPDFKAKDIERVTLRQLKVRRWLNRYKLDHGCIDCDYRECAEALDIDHTTGKTGQVSWKRSIAAVHAEIQDFKCLVRCVRCHRLKTWCQQIGIDYVVGKVPIVLPKQIVRRQAADLKIKQGCIACKYNAHFAPLEFHHTEQKGMDVNRIQSIERFIIEMGLFPCIVICGNCHRKLHFGKIINE